jgi:hypothetical protein
MIGSITEPGLPTASNGARVIPIASKIVTRLSFQEPYFVHTWLSILIWGRSRVLCSVEVMFLNEFNRLSAKCLEKRLFAIAVTKLSNPKDIIAFMGTLYVREIHLKGFAE